VAAPSAPLPWELRLSRRPFRAPWLLAVVPLTVAAVISGAVPAGAGPTTETTLVGTVRLLAADTVDPENHEDGHVHSHEEVGTAEESSPHAGSEDVYVPVLQTAGDTLLLTGKEAEDIQPNTSVEVSGTVRGEEMAVTSTEVLGSAPVTALPTSGNVRTLVMLATWPGLARDDVTQASATQQMFGDTKDWYRNASYSAVSMTGEVTPWLSIAGPAGNRCYSDHVALMQQAKNAAAAAGYVLSGYDNFVVYFPYAGGLTGNDCSWYSGWAYVGSTGVWINGYMDRRTTVHELGHNYGLYHSHSYLCPDGGVGGADCDFSDYGDAYDAMGSSGYVGNFNASQKSVLGWFGGRSVDLSAGGTATLAPMDQQSAGIRGASVTVSGSRTYWLEYRQPTGADAWLPEEGTDGVLVHLRDDTLLHAAEPSLYYRDTGAALLDVRPGDGVDVWSATLPSGQSWTTPEGVTISVGAVTPTGAQVTVANGVQPPGAPQAVRVSAGSGQGTVTWEAPVSEGGSPIVSYRVTAGSGGKGVTVPASARSATVTGLGTGWYTFWVAATNGQASGPGTASSDLWITDGTGPTVTAHSPATDARSVGVASVVTVTVSEDVVGVDSSSFVLYGPGWQVVPAAVTYDSTTRTATLDPSVDLAARTRYAVDLIGGIRDSDWNWLPYSTWSFSTGPGPTVTSRAPMANALAVAVGANITAQFSVPVTGWTSSSVQLRTPAGRVVPAALSYNSSTRTVTINPTTNLAADTRYTVTLTGGPTGVRDGVDNPLATTTWSFTTGTAPVVAARTPGSGVTGVSVAADVAVRFNEPVRGVSSSTVQLKTPAGSVVPAALSYNSTTRTVTLNPKANLARGTRYTVVVVGGTSAIRDGAGNPLRTLTWVFRTR
jgi:M6 family metalloprotease-like protein